MSGHTTGGEQAGPEALAATRTAGATGKAAAASSAGHSAGATLAANVERLVHEFAASPANVLSIDPPQPAYDAPLVGFACGADPLFLDYKRYVGPFHWTPVEAFATAFPESPAAAEELSVISWVFPLRAAVRAANASERKKPSRLWAHGKYDGTRFLHALAANVVGWLGERGYPAVEPWSLPQWRCDGLEAGRGRVASTWSERHMAYAAGLGTFGLSDGLITAAGKAMRCGSVVARVALPPTPRPYTDRHAYCLHYHGADGCSACAERCPIGAIGPEGHDKDRCGAYLDALLRSLVEPVYGLPTDCCGLCQTGVLCEAGIPPALVP